MEDNLRCKNKMFYNGEFLFTTADVLNIIGDIQDVAEAMAMAESAKDGDDELDRCRLKWENLIVATALMRNRVRQIAKDRNADYSNAKKVKVFDRRDIHCQAMEGIYSLYNKPQNLELIEEVRENLRNGDMGGYYVH